MEIAITRRDLNHTLTELGRAIEQHAVAQAADLYALAWRQAAQAPPSETREQRAQLAKYKEIIASPRWQHEERRRAADPPSGHTARAEPRTVRRSGPVAEPVSPQPVVVWSSGRVAERSTPPGPAPRLPGKQTTPTPSRRSRSSGRAAEPALLESGPLWEIATQLRPLLEQTARAGATISWPAIRKRLPGLPRLHCDDESVILWLVDEERRDGEPLLGALVTVGDRQMHPRFPVIAEQLGLSTSGSPAQQRAVWGYEVLKTHQHWRHRR